MTSAETTPRLPNLFCAGAMRAGTTYLYEALSRHLEVYMSPVKEPNYFAREDGPPWMGGIQGRRVRRYLRGPMRPRHAALVTCWEDYLALFRAAGAEPVVGEASPSYLYSKRAPEEIASVCGDVRVVISLRQPVDRALSHHGMDVARGVTSRSFDEAVGDPVDPTHPLVDSSLYAARVERYVNVFGRDRVRVYLFEELESQPGGILDDLATFLGIDASGFGPADRRPNVGLSPRLRGVNVLLERSGLKRLLRRTLPSRAVGAGKRLYYAEVDRQVPSGETLAALREVFRPDVERLQGLLGRDLSHWLE